jgi:hypothetical protein
MSYSIQSNLRIQSLAELVLIETDKKKCGIEKSCNGDARCTPDLETFAPLSHGLDSETFGFMKWWFGWFQIKKKIKKKKKVVKGTKPTPFVLSCPLSCLVLSCY